MASSKSKNDEKKDVAEGEGAGRPTLYNIEYCEQVEKLCKLGATDKEIADFFEIAESTLNLWKGEHPEFMESIKKGKILADAQVAEKLYQRAIGYEHDSEEIKVVSDGNGMGSSVERVPIKKVYPPDPAAAIFWLKNRQKKKWRDKIEHGLTDNDGNDVITIFQLPDNGRGKSNQAAEGISGESSE